MIEIDLLVKGFDLSSDFLLNLFFSIFTYVLVSECKLQESFMSFLCNFHHEVALLLNHYKNLLSFKQLQTTTVLIGTK